MDEQTSYLNFLKTFLSEEIYIVRETEAISDNTVFQEQNMRDQTDTSVGKSPSASIQIEGKKDSEVAIILNEVFTSEVNDRFIKMIGNLGFSVNELAVINLQKQERANISFEQILDVPAPKQIFFGLKTIYPNENLPEDFESKTFPDKKILFLPAFDTIIQDKKLVLQCWDKMKEFTTDHKDDQ